MKKNRDKINEVNLDNNIIKQNLNSNFNDDIVDNWFALPLKSRISQRYKPNNKIKINNLNKENKPRKKEIYLS